MADEPKQPEAPQAAINIRDLVAIRIDCLRIALEMKRLGHQEDIVEIARRLANFMGTG